MREWALALGGELLRAFRRTASSTLEGEEHRQVMGERSQD